VRERDRSDVTQRACSVLERVRRFETGGNGFETQCYLDILKMASVVQEHERLSQCLVL
jgi:hypothetical protein